MTGRARVVSAAATLLMLIAAASGRGQPTAPESKLPPDPKKAAEEAAAAAADKRLAQKMMPTDEELKANGGWRMPWDFPAGTKLPLPQVERDGYMTFYRTPPDRYWEARQYESAFIGLSPNEVPKRIKKVADAIKAKDPADGESATTTMIYWLDPAGVWNAEPGAGAGLRYMTERQTRFTLCRASQWDDLTRIGEATQAVWDIARKYRKDLGETPGGQIIFMGRETTDPDWLPANKRLGEALRGCDSALELMSKNQVGWTTAVVHVRKLNPDAIGGDPKRRFVKDLTEEDAQRLQQEFDAASKAQMAVAAPFIEKQLETERAFISKLKAGGFPTLSNEEALAFKQQKWKDFQAPTVKLQRRADIGAADCYVLSTFSYWTFKSTDTLGRYATKVNRYAASLRNGVYLAQIEIMSTMAEEEVKKDMEFLLRHLAKRTSAALGGTSSP